MTLVGHGLTTSGIQRSVRTKLAGADIKVEPAGEAPASRDLARLHVRVNARELVPGTYLYSIQPSLFQETRLLRDPSVRLGAVTWIWVSFGHIRLAELNALRSEIDRHLVRFIRDYRDANRKH